MKGLPSSTGCRAAAFHPSLERSCPTRAWSPMSWSSLLLVNMHSCQGTPVQHLQAPADRHLQLGQRAKGVVGMVCNLPALLLWLLECEVGNWFKTWHHALMVSGQQMQLWSRTQLACADCRHSLADPAGIMIQCSVLQHKIKLVCTRAELHDACMNWRPKLCNIKLRCIDKVRYCAQGS